MCFLIHRNAHNMTNMANNGAMPKPLDRVGLTVVLVEEILLKDSISALLAVVAVVSLVSSKIFSEVDPVASVGSVQEDREQPALVEARIHAIQRLR